MKHLSLSDFRRSLNLTVPLAMLAFAATVFFLQSEDLIRVFRDGWTIYPGKVHSFVLTGLAHRNLLSLVPILAVLPFAGAYVDDIKSKYVVFSLVRCGTWRYLISKCVVSFVSGFVVILGGACLSWGVSAYVFSAAENDPRMVPQVIAAILSLSLCGGFWALLGITVSAFMESKYIAYAAPFILFYLLIILKERYFEEMSLLYPLNWGNRPAAAALLIPLAAGAFCIKGRRRMKTL